MFAASAGIQGISSLGNAYSQSVAARSQGEYQKNVQNINKNFAEMNATEAIKRGEKDAQTVRTKVKQTVGAQRAALAAQGIDIDVGSAQDVLQETREAGKLDITTVKNNAFREAWGFKVSALEATMKGEFAELSGNFAARRTLLTGGMDALSSSVKAYTTYKKP